MRKLSRPWHGPYRIITLQEPDISVSKIYQPQSPAICVHQSRVKPCPLNFPAGFYWYGGNNKGLGRVPKWVEQVLDEKSTQIEVDDMITSSTMNDTQVYDQESNSSTETSENESPEESMTDSEDEQCDSDKDDDEMLLEAETVPTVDINRRNNTHYGLRQNPRPNRRWS